VVSFATFSEPHGIEADYRNDNIVDGKRRHIGEAVRRNCSDLPAEVGSLEGAVAFKPLRQRSKVIVAWREHWIYGIWACKGETRALEAQPLPISVHVVISGNAKDAFLRHSGCTD